MRKQTSCLKRSCSLSPLGVPAPDRPKRLDHFVCIPTKYVWDLEVKTEKDVVYLVEPISLHLGYDNNIKVFEKLQEWVYPVCAVHNFELHNQLQEPDFIYSALLLKGVYVALKRPHYGGHWTWKDAGLAKDHKSTNDFVWCRENYEDYDKDRFPWLYIDLRSSARVGAEGSSGRRWIEYGSLWLERALLVNKGPGLKRRFLCGPSPYTLYQSSKGLYKKSCILAACNTHHANMMEERTQFKMEELSCPDVFSTADYPAHCFVSRTCPCERT